MKDLSRRDVLKVAGSLPVAAVLGSIGSVAQGVRTQPQTKTPSDAAISKSRVIPAGGKSFGDPVRRFFGELRNHHGALRPFPISRAFQILPFHILENSAAEALIRRGSV